MLKKKKTLCDETFWDNLTLFNLCWVQQLLLRWWSWSLIFPKAVTGHVLWTFLRYSFLLVLSAGVRIISLLPLSPFVLCPNQNSGGGRHCWKMMACHYKENAWRCFPVLCVKMLSPWWCCWYRCLGKVDILLASLSCYFKLLVKICFRLGQLSICTDGSATRCLQKCSVIALHRRLLITCVSGLNCEL